MNKAELETGIQPEVPEHTEKEESPEISPEVSAENETEQTLDRGIDRLAAKAEGVESLVKNVEKVAPDKTEQLKESISRIWGRSLDTIRMMALMAALNYVPEALSRPRFAVEKKVEQSGEVTYKHADRQTTQILDYLSGKQELPREVRMNFVKESILTDLNLNSLPIPKDFENFDESQLRSYIGDFYASTNKESLRDPELAKFILSSEHDKNWIDMFTVPKYKFDRKLYESLWEIEQEVGNPKIRFGLNSWGKSYTGYYESGSNTIYINPPDKTRGRARRADQSTFVAEAAHAKQAKVKPYSTSIQFTKDMIRTVFRSIQTGKSLSSAQSELYDIPGTVEYEAHKEIEPELNKKLK